LWICRKNSGSIQCIVDETLSIRVEAAESLRSLTSDDSLFCFLPDRGTLRCSEQWNSEWYFCFVHPAFSPFSMAAGQRLHCGAAKIVCILMIGSGWGTRECASRLQGRGRFGRGMAGY
jgi:hypothetical protein